MRLLLAIALLCCTALADLPQFKTPADLEEFVFPTDDDKLTGQLDALFEMRQAGRMITMASKLGPEYALRAAQVMQPYPEFERHYRDLAKYMESFGPCQKQQMKAEEGWWSGYSEAVPEGYCTEITKMVAAQLLWGQVHYCKQLLTGEVKPKTPVPDDSQPPWRLDQPPVKSAWLKTEPLYALAAAAVEFKFQTVLRKRAAEPRPHDEKLQQSAAEAAAELEKEKPDRELLAIALAKVVLRNYESTHLRHMDRIRQKGKAAKQP